MDSHSLHMMGLGANIPCEIKGKGLFNAEGFNNRVGKMLGSRGPQPFRSSNDESDSVP